jgi:tetratricopeptide (TPR) repeat protein
MSNRFAKGLMLSAALVASAAPAAPEAAPPPPRAAGDKAVTTSRPKAPPARAAPKPAPKPAPAAVSTSRPPSEGEARPAAQKPSVRIFKSDVRAVPVPKGPLDVRVASAPEFSRIEFRWTGAVAYTTRRDGKQLIFLFNRYAEPDIARLRVDPPAHVEGAEARRAPGGGLELVLTLADDAAVTTGRADGAIFVNVAAAAKPAETSDAEAPAFGKIEVVPALNGPNLQLSFPFKKPVGAAVFRRGDAVWVVFDAQAELDLSKAPTHLPQARAYQPVSGAGFTALRISAPPEVKASASHSAGVWTVTLGPKRLASSPVLVEPERDAGPAALSAALAGSTAVRWITDPEVGDRIAVVTALGPAKGLASRRASVETILIPTAHGLVVQPLTEDLVVDADGDLVRIFRPKGLALSNGGLPIKTAAKAKIDLPRSAGMPAIIDPAWAKTGEGGFMARYDALLAASAEEAGQAPKGGSHAARYGLARFLIASGLVHEGIGVLEMLRASDEGVLNDPDFRGLRGAARVLAGRLAEAEADFASPPVMEDPSSALWRGYIAWSQGDHVHGREQLSAGASALPRFSAQQRARFARAIAETAISAGDLGQAAAQLKIARGWKPPTEESLGLSLAQAKLSEAQGASRAALKIYEIVARTPFGALSAEAELRATRIKLAQGLITAPTAIKTYESLRWRWRGDDTELQVIRTLGQLYLAYGRHREALAVMRTAGASLPNSPISIALHNETTNVFRQLFLDGGADGMEPVQALALFYDFRELTPVGNDGDMMIRRLAQRLVTVDLLDHAAQLLEHQSKNRLDGVPRAQVATDLALIYLMDRKPEAALGALAASRTTVLPTALNLERRIIQARALMQVGRLEHALEVLGPDPSPDAQEVRAEVYWKQGAWPLAGAALERSLAGRWTSDRALSGGEEARLLKAAVAYSLADDQPALNRLRTRFDGLIATARSPDALKVALEGIDDDRLTAADLTRVVSEADAFTGWVGEMKRRFRAKPVKAAATAAPAAAPAPPKAA